MHTNDWSSRNEISLVHIKHPPVLHCRVRQCNTQTYAVCVCACFDNSHSYNFLFNPSSNIFASHLLGVDRKPLVYEDDQLSTEALCS